MYSFERDSGSKKSFPPPPSLPSSLNFVILFFSLFFCEMAHLHTNPPTRRAFNGATNRSPFFHLSPPFPLLPLLRFFSSNCDCCQLIHPFFLLSRCGDFNERRRKTIFHLLLSPICCGKSFFLLFGQSSHSLPPTGPLFRQRRASQIMCPFSLFFFRGGDLGCGGGVWVYAVVACVSVHRRKWCLQPPPPLVLLAPSPSDRHSTPSPLFSKEKRKKIIFSS